jgi:hypothetical protein
MDNLLVNKLLCVQSTGGSTGEDEDDTQTAETRRNTQHNEQLLDREPAEVNTKEQSLCADHQFYSCGDWCFNVKGNRY